MTDRTPITNFYPDTEFYFLSNFYQADPTLPERLWGYPSVEHFYQAMKTLDRTRRQMIKTADTARGARQMGKPGRLVLRPGWDDGLKDEVMMTALRAKFAPGTELGARLLDTYPAALCEGNYWHDIYWGVCNDSRCRRGPHEPVGENQLGGLLVQVRYELSLQTSADQY